MVIDLRALNTAVDFQVLHLSKTAGQMTNLNTDIIHFQLTFMNC